MNIHVIFGHQGVGPRDGVVGGREGGIKGGVDDQGDAILGLVLGGRSLRNNRGARAWGGGCRRAMVIVCGSAVGGGAAVGGAVGTGFVDNAVKKFLVTWRLC